MKTTLAGLTLLAALAVAADVSATTYQVGPSRTHKQLSAVAGLLNPGDVVEVDGNATYSGVLWTRSGSAQAPITIRGIASGTQRPLINAGGLADAFRMDVNHYVVEDLVISNATTRCVYLHGNNLTLRRVVVHTCLTHGILGADQDTGDMLLTEVEVYNQGNSGTPNPGHHPIYIATDHAMYPNAVLRIEKSWIHDNHSGNSIKSRARTVKIFYNWIEATNGQNHTVEAIGPDPDGAPPGGLCPVPNGSNDAVLCNGEIVGNVLIARGANANMMRLGSDATGDSHGRYHVVNNTFIANGTFSSSSSAMIRAFGPLQSIELHNNIFWVEFDGVRIVRDAEAAWENGRRVTGTRNVVTGNASTYASGIPGAAIQGLTNTVFTTTGAVFANVSAAALANPATIDVRLQSTSSARRAGNAGNTSTAGYQIPNPTNLPVLQPPMLRPGPGALGQATRRPKPTDNSGFVVPNEISIGPFEYVFVPPGLDPAADQDNDGVPNGVEVGEGLNTLTKDNDVFTSARLFAMQQYRDFLGREGDAGGIQFYDNLVTTGASARANVIESFFNSPEFSGSVSPIARLYFATFLRIPDYDGLIFQVSAFRAGTPLAVIANNFTLSPEFQATYGSLTDSQYVALLYQNILGRTASQPEIDFHVARLTGGETRGAVLVGFSESPEYQQLTAIDVYVTMMYVGMLRRAPEQAGFDFWVAYMEGGNPGLALILGFLNAPEYHNRFLP